MKNYFFLLALAIPSLGFSQWTKTEIASRKVKKNQEKLEYSALYTLNENQLRLNLKDVPDRYSNREGTLIFLPTAGGKLEQFKVWESSNMAPELQAKYPDIRSYVGSGVDDPTAYLRFSFSPEGFSSMISRSGISEFIEPYTEDREVYAVFDSNAQREQDKEPFESDEKKIIEPQKKKIKKIRNRKRN